MMHEYDLYYNQTPTINIKLWHVAEGHWIDVQLLNWSLTMYIKCNVTKFAINVPYDMKCTNYVGIKFCNLIAQLEVYILDTYKFT